ncbi:hypothetical protein BJX64DRAFT_150973 [Aspergillus heterothallicus]
MSLASPSEVRRRSTRKRSRHGCRNCKLRKLKCDESKPQCQTCCLFGVVCNFILHVPDLHPVAGGTADRALLARGKPQIAAPQTNNVWTADSLTAYQLSARCQDFITRYLGRSLITPDDANMRQVNLKLLELAFGYPFLMHASLAVALTYDRHLTGSSESRRTLEECYHWSRSTALLNARLQQPIEEGDRDPIWGTATALAILASSSPDADTPEQAWPLKSSTDSASDLEWLRLHECKMGLWNMLDPMRPGSIFRVMAATYAEMNVPLPARGIEGVPLALAVVCALTEESTPRTSPYFDPAHAVSHILVLPDSEVTTGPTQLFLQTIHGSFKKLLLSRDPVALLLLHLWYQKAGRCLWWIEMRSRIEGPAICMYLRRYHKDREDILQFLPGGALSGKWGG